MLPQAANSGLTLASRRRPARGHPRRRARGAIPDWVWGLVLGLAAIAIGAVIFLVAGGGFGGGSTCDNPLAPLETSDITAKGFAQEDAGLGRVVDLINQGNRSGAETAFYGPVHNFTHNVDPSLRQKNQQLGKDLCQAVLKIEDDLAFGASSLDVALDAQRIRDLLKRGAQALSYPPP